MKKTPVYLQIFSLTDHTKALSGRYQGDYQGINSQLQTSMFSDQNLCIAKQTKTKEGKAFSSDDISKAQVVLAYRHSDTGELRGTSETLWSISNFPWTDLPGMEIRDQKENGQLMLHLWNQDLPVPVGPCLRIHFGKTRVYVKNFGSAKKITWTEEKLSGGPSDLHANEQFQEITLAPPTGSGFMVKQGQETEH